MSLKSINMLIGLTGVMGSGKSTALRCFKNLGAEVRNADSFVHQLYKEDDFVKKNLVDSLGADIIKNGVISRQKIASIVFQDEQKLTWLNNFIHPILKKELLKKSSLAIIEIPLLFEKNWTSEFFKVISLWRQPNLIAQSIQHISYQKSRQDNQFSQNKKLELADYGLINNNCLINLEIQCQLILKKLKNIGIE